MTSICLPNFVLLTLISTILYAVRTIFLYYKVGGGGPRNNNVQQRPERRAWIFLAGVGGGGLFVTKKLNSPV